MELSLTLALSVSIPGENECSPKASPIGAEVEEVGWMGHNAAVGHAAMVVEEAAAEAKEEAVEAEVGGG